MGLLIGADFDGETYDSGQDKLRLSTQLGRVFHAMTGGEWWTLEILSSVTRAPEASVSARLRDLKKKKFGGMTIERRRSERYQGLWDYRMIPLEKQGALL